MHHFKYLKAREMDFLSDAVNWKLQQNISETQIEVEWTPLHTNFAQISIVADWNWNIESFGNIS